MKTKIYVTPDDEESSDKGSGSPAHPNLWDE